MDDNDPLCCCEYFNPITNERDHLLLACCDFSECITECFQRTVCCRCRSVSSDLRGKMFMKFLDRLRIPTKNGAKKITWDVVAPIFLIVLIHVISALHLYCAIIIFLLLPVALGCLYAYYIKKNPKTRFFNVWLCFSAVFLLCLFEFTVPLLELLPEENFIFIVLLFLSVFCFYKTNQKAELNRLGVTENVKSEDQVTLLMADAKGGESDDNDFDPDRTSCKLCQKYIPARTYHCNICKTCILRKDHHNLFLSCCIGRFNHRYFFLGCVFAFSGLLLFANLCLTSICHSFPIFYILGAYVLLPDNCTDVFGEFDIAMCFVGSIYALIMAVVFLCVIIQQIYLISQGITAIEHKKGERPSRNTSICRTWKNFCC